MKKAVRVTAVGTHDLPPEYSEQIGRIIIKFAYLEQYLKRIPWVLLNLSMAQGALAVRSPSMGELIDMIADIDSLSSPKLPKEAITILKKILPELERKRDQIAHSGWAKVDEDFCIHVSKGRWSGQGVLDAPTGKKQVIPEFEPMSLGRLQEIAGELDQAVSEARKLGVALERDG